MSKHTLAELPVKEPVAGFRGRFVNTPTMTLAYWKIKEGATLPEHAHPHEQVLNVIRGTLELTIGGAVHQLHAGMVYAIPGDVPHAARAVTDCYVIDVFHPVREDYQ